MVRSLVIHIGDHKTGSTAIQEALAAGSLRGSDGIDPPAWCYPALRNHNALAKALQKRGAPGRANKAFSRAARHMARSEAAVGILSAEAFEEVAPARLRERIARHFPDLMDSLRIVAYVRPHAERLLSSHAELIKIGHFLGSLEQFHARTLANRRFFYTERFLAWREVFGSDFVLRPMIRSALREGDVVTDFLHLALSGATPPPLPAGSSNPSLPLGDLAVLQVMQAALQALPGPTRHRLGWKMAELLRADPPAGGGVRPALHADLAARVVEAYREDAAALDAEFFAGIADGRPMSTALEASVARAVPEPQSIEAADHHGPEALRLIAAFSQLTAELAAGADDGPDEAGAD